jgi:hypothetical protein
VVNHNVWGGNRSGRGAETQSHKSGVASRSFIPIHFDAPHPAVGLNPHPVSMYHRSREGYFLSACFRLFRRPGPRASPFPFRERSRLPAAFSAV